MVAGSDLGLLILNRMGLDCLENFSIIKNLVLEHLREEKDLETMRP